MLASRKPENVIIYLDIFSKYTALLLLRRKGRMDIGSSTASLMGPSGLGVLPSHICPIHQKITPRDKVTEEERTLAEFRNRKRHWQMTPMFNIKLKSEIPSHVSDSTVDYVS